MMLSDQATNGNANNKEWEMSTPIYTEQVDKLQVKVFADRRQMGAAVALAVADRMKKLLAEKKTIRMVFGAAPSQNEFLDTLTRMEDLPWDRVEVFHMDEYIGLASDAEQRFSLFLRRKLFDIVKPGKVHLLDPKSENPEEECKRYTQLFLAEPIDIICLGIGENGHIAFNDPPVADFADPETVKVVELDQACRQQQVNDKCFESVEKVPTHALTLTVPAMMSGQYLFTVVPGSNKKNAVHHTLRDDISTKCPASILRTHENCVLFVDVDSLPVEA